MYKHLTAVFTTNYETSSMKLTVKLAIDMFKVKINNVIALINFCLPVGSYLMPAAPWNEKP